MKRFLGVLIASMFLASAAYAADEPMKDTKEKKADSKADSKDAKAKDGKAKAKNGDAKASDKTKEEKKGEATK